MGGSSPPQPYKSRHPHLSRGEIGNCDIVALMNTYGIPDTIFIENCSLEDMREERPEDSNVINIFASYFEAGLTLPFHPFTRQVLNCCGISPSQVSGNFFRIIAGFIFLANLAGVKWDHDDLFQDFLLKFSSKYENFYLQRRKSIPMMLLGVPDSDKSWDQFPLKISGAWEFGVEEDLSSDNVRKVPRSRASSDWCSEFNSTHSPRTLTNKHISVSESILSLSLEDRNFGKLLKRFGVQHQNLPPRYLRDQAPRSPVSSPAAEMSRPTVRLEETLGEDPTIPPLILKRKRPTKASGKTGSSQSPAKSGRVKRSIPNAVESDIPGDDSAPKETVGGQVQDVQINVPDSKSVESEKDMLTETAGIDPVINLSSTTEESNQKLPPPTKAPNHDPPAPVGPPPSASDAHVEDNRDKGKRKSQEAPPASNRPRKRPAGFPEQTGTGTSRESDLPWAPVARTSKGPLTVESCLLKSHREAVALARALATPKDKEIMSQSTPLESLQNAGNYMMKALLWAMRAEMPLQGAESEIVRLHGVIETLESRSSSLQAEGESLRKLNEDNTGKLGLLQIQFGQSQREIEVLKKKIEESKSKSEFAAVEMERLKELGRRSAQEYSDNRKELEESLQAKEKELADFKVQTELDFKKVDEDYIQQVKVISDESYLRGFRDGFAKCKK